jgi:polyisoprenoid-binding protein YceI
VQAETATAPPQSGAPAPSATAGTAAPVSAALPVGAVRYTLVPAQSEARYRVREQLAALNFPNDAVGATKSMEGAIVFDEKGTVVPSASRLMVNVNTLKSDENLRDNFLRTSALQTGRYPTVTFVPTAIEGLAWPPPAAGDLGFQMTGDLTVRNVTKPVTWQVKARADGGGVTGQAVTSFTFGDFGMQQPRVAVVLSVEDKIQLEFDFRFTRAS